MNSEIFWEVFESTGSIEAFLTYSRSEDMSSETYEIAANTYVVEENQIEKMVKEAVKPLPGKRVKAVQRI